MMLVFGALLLAGIQAVTPSNEVADPQIVAQALDRCMTTYAVRLTKTEATDEAIFADATRACSALDEQLKGALKEKLPPAQASDLIAQMDASSKPNFMALIAKIRRDRAARSAN
ncbi:MAG: hypothetical protein PGN16_11015 [Sphingomonas phyllosphaerae]|uniref:hypothetical protein n=1 Tax=Sphingomonas phyllosphaerae TaxID=257003 RepID=UPI002FF6D398